MALSFAFLPAALLVPVLAWAAMPVYLPKDSPVQLRLKQTLSSSFSHINDRVEFEVSEDVKVGDFVAIPAGSLAWGVIVEAVPRSRMLRSGKLAVDIQGVCLVTGEKAGLRGVPSSRDGLRARDEDDGPSTNILALPALPVLLFVYGKDVMIPEGKLTTAYTSQGVRMTPQDFTNSTPNTTCDRAADPTPPGGSGVLSTVIIRSAPSDAELMIDGHYQGNTPSTVRLTPGDHVITAMAPGRKTWERTIHLMGGDEINVTAALEERAPLTGDRPTLAIDRSAASGNGSSDRAAPSPAPSSAPASPAPRSPSPVPPSGPTRPAVLPPPVTPSGPPIVPPPQP